MNNVELNNLSTLNFKFKLSITPHIEYRAQRVKIPSLNLGTATRETPFVRIPLPGNMAYDDLQIGFLVGENMKDYLEIYNWMVKLGYPDYLGQYEDITSDCSVMILNSNLNANINIRFTDVFPVSLSEIDFDTTLTEVQYATATVTFKFTRWYVEPVD